MLIAIFVILSIIALLLFWIFSIVYRLNDYLHEYLNANISLVNEIKERLEKIDDIERHLESIDKRVYKATKGID